ncbi:MAG: DNA methyltransferase, partial [Candidatus Zixiibacteriota bacterium]
MNEKEFYGMVERRDDWAFSDLARRETNEITHSYHKYPAKFIPQLARALIKEFTKEGDFIWDPFCGSGTLNLEAFRTFRNNLGSDTNPTSVLIARSKITAIEPAELSEYNKRLLKAIEERQIKNESFYISKRILNGNINILRKWFPKKSLLELGHILWQIKKQKSRKKHKEFALCAFSSILKRSSYWLNSSIKAQIDPEKIPELPLFYFKKQLASMEKANFWFFDEAKNNDTLVRIFRHNAKHELQKQAKKLDCIITSPPYVVSYDYSDIFKLSTHFLFWQQEYRQFRKSFIGTPLRKKSHRSFNIYRPEQPIVDSIVESGVRKSLIEYYKDMSIFLGNAKNCIKYRGLLIMVIGDTQLRGVKIPNAY